MVVPMLQLRRIKDVLYQLRFIVGFWPTVLRLARLFGAEEVDIVHSKSMLSVYSPWAAWICRLPHVWQLGELPNLPQVVLRCVGWLILRLSCNVVPVSEAVANSFFGPVSQRNPKVVTIPDGIEIDEFKPTTTGERIRGTLSIPQSAPLVGFVARLVPWKGPEVFIQSASVVRRERADVHFLICGGELPGYEGYSQQLRRRGSELGLDGRLHFLDWVSPVDMPDLMASLDILVHSSVRPEPFGLVIVEALASATVVVATRGGGVEEILEHQVSGILVTPGDWAGTASAIVQLVDNPSRARSMGLAGRQRVTRLFGVEAHVAAITQLYDAL